MTVRFVGAGLGRTGTSSLRDGLQMLLGGPCYHMSRLTARPGDVDAFRNAVAGQPPDWADFFTGFVATLDWPAVAFWEQIAAANPDALVLLSTRASADEWYSSFEKTIVPVLLDSEKYAGPSFQVARAVTFGLFTPDVANPTIAKAAYEEHNARVRALVPPSRLVEWQPGDGWGPLCAALGVAEPTEPFPHANTTDDFRDLLGLDGEPAPSVGGVRRVARRAKRLVGRVRRQLRG